MRNSNLRGALVFALATAASTLFAAAPITIVVTDPPGVGFNDLTPAEPEGGNTGATIGEQRLNVFRFAAGIWSSKLDSSIPIRVRASFKPLPCSDDTGIAGAAMPINVFQIVRNPEVISNVWYPAALANKLTDTVLDPNTEEIEATFNPDLGQPGCALGKNWYYGLDAQAPPSRINMAVIVLHELAHGLGFLPLAQAGGSRLGGLGDVYSQYVLDVTTGKTWNQMTDEERGKSITNTSHVVWTGINVRKDVPKVLQPGTPELRVMAPASAAGDFAVSTAEFGAPIVSLGVSGELVVAVDRPDAAGPLTTTACSPLLNAAEAAGRIVLADRGTCSFVTKALNAQAAGAIGLIVVDNVQETPPVNLGGTDPSVTIPAVHITLTDGNALKAVLGREGMKVALVTDPNLRNGADAAGRPMLFTPNPSTGLSPVGHWDISASPNQLMEPNIMPDLGLAVEPPNDLTLSLLRDLGWFSDFDGVPDGVDQCPGSDSGRNLMILGCDTGVSNTTYSTGCRISDYYKPCVTGDSANLDACVESVSNDMLKMRAIATTDVAKIQACAVRSVHP